MSKLQRMKRRQGFNKTKYPELANERLNKLSRPPQLSDRERFLIAHPGFGEPKVKRQSVTPGVMRQDLQ